VWPSLQALVRLRDREIEMYDKPLDILDKHDYEKWYQATIDLEKHLPAMDARIQQMDARVNAVLPELNQAASECRAVEQGTA
jgi:hypothetical protein